MSRRHLVQPLDLQFQQGAGETDGPHLLTQVAVCRRLGISDETWRRWRQAGRTPAAVEMPSGRSKWRVSDIEAMERRPAVIARVARHYFAKASGLRVVPERGQGLGGRR